MQQWALKAIVSEMLVCFWPSSDLDVWACKKKKPTRVTEQILRMIDSREHSKIHKGMVL